MSVERPIELVVSTQRLNWPEVSQQQTVRVERDNDKLVMKRDGLVVLEAPLDDLELIVRLYQGERVLEARSGKWDCGSLGHLYTAGHVHCGVCNHESVPAG